MDRHSPLLHGRGPRKSPDNPSDFVPPTARREHDIKVGIPEPEEVKKKFKGKIDQNNPFLLLLLLLLHHHFQVHFSSFLLLLLLPRFLVPPPSYV
jgi:hypothetical protein